MFRGFYNLTSGMLSQGRRLDVVSNNITNISTAGYKADHYTDSTFQEVMLSRVGNKDKSRSQEIGQQSYILAPSELFTDYTQGGLEETGLPLDFAIDGEGYFAIDRDGQVAYTRAGSFTLDDEGYLCLAGQGRVLSNERQPIQLPTDNLYVDVEGGLYSLNNRGYLGTLGVFAFEDEQALEHNERGLFQGGQPQAGENYVIRHKMVERSNVNMVQEMVSMMTTQISKIYDQVMTRATTELGRLG